MPEDNSIDVKVYPADGGPRLDFTDVQYISLVNSDTYGIPALISERGVKDELPVRILYLSTENIVAAEAVRHA